MCTGDHRAAAEAVAKDCGIDKDRVAPWPGFFRLVGIFTDQHGHGHSCSWWGPLAMNVHFGAVACEWCNMATHRCGHPR